MRRKIALLLLTVTAITFTACSTSDKGIASNTSSQQHSQTIPIVENVKTVLGQTSYAGIAKAGKESFIVQKETGSAYEIVDALGNNVIEGQFDYFNLDLEGDYYAVGKKIQVDESTIHYDYSLYNGDNELVFTNKDYPLYHIYRLNEGILQLRREITTEVGEDKIKRNYYSCYIDLNNGGTAIANISDNVDTPVLFVAGYSNGIAPFVAERLVTVNATTRLYTAIDKSGNFQELTLSDGTLARAKTASISKNGWMLVESIDKATVQSKGVYFYNVATKQEVKWPDGYDSWEAFYDGGFGAVFTVGNYVAMTPSIDQEDADSEYDIFDLNSGTIIADTNFASIDLRTYDSGYMVAKKNSQFAYVNQNFEVASNWFVSAADIVNGYGLIVDNGTVYTINSKFEKETAVTAGEVVTYLGGQYYSIKHNNDYYLLQVIPAE